MAESYTSTYAANGAAVDAALAKADTALQPSDVQTDAADRTEGRIARIDLVPVDPFREVCQIAGMEPTLYLDFARQDYRLYNSATGLERKALTDILDSTSGDIRNSTGTAFNALGLLESQAADVPRLDFDPETGLCRGVLVEESRQNKFLNSLEDGTSLSTQTVTVTAASWTISFYGSGSITLSGAHTATITGTDDTTRAALTFTPSAGSLTCTVSGTVKWANCELGAFATSHIPTAGAAATRAADTLTISGTRFSDFYRQGVGTFVHSTSHLPATILSSLLATRGVSSGSRIYIYTSGLGSLVFRRSASGYSNENIASLLSYSQTETALAMSFEDGAQSVSVNGGTTLTNTLALTPDEESIVIGMTTTTLGQSDHQRVIYFPRRLGNSTLQLLSSLGA